ncbi:RICIN domain-containing protein [Plantactinospora sp. KLBMP9567]|uniref:RICIN domain-containing protein n=1 Tax=Plantactinospora sp. KLBMP9567 TaxID=3085900 RepID=UPI00298125CA|nr:RICIN domain-containing protein [Plantactinospora sp. KLBMP9567]MDW5326583.1 RICIN domain-containing protein [Plantactinospora sp. KLBMP9567]
MAPVSGRPVESGSRLGFGAGGEEPTCSSVRRYEENSPGHCARYWRPPSRWWRRAIPPPRPGQRRSTSSSGMCVEVGWGGLNDGDLVDQYPCHGGANQKWFLENQPDGFQIRAVHTGKCLEAGRRHLVVKLAYQEQCAGTPFQRWLLIEVGEWPTNRFTFRNVHHSSECLGIYNNSQSEWAVAALLPCSHTAPNQHLSSPEIGCFPG